VLREQLSCLAIDLTPSPLRAITRISTASSWVNIDGTKKAVILSQVGHFYFGAVGQYYFGGDSFAHQCSLLACFRSCSRWPCNVVVQSLGDANLITVPAAWPDHSAVQRECTGKAPQTSNPPKDCTRGGLLVI
jgi:hypothetical protein